MTGKTDYDLKCSAVNRADFYRKQDINCVERKTIKSITIDKYRDGEIKLFVGSSSLITKGKNDFIFMYVIELPAIVLNSFYQNKFFSNEFGPYEIISEIPIENSKLSKRETECMFFLMRGNTAKEIAKILHLSNRTVESYLENIKIKLNCSKRSELVDKGYYLGLQNYIPENFFSTQIP